MYEAHLSFSISHEARIRESSNALDGWKFSMNLDDPKLGPGKRCYLTKHDANLDKLIQEGLNLAEWYWSSGIKPDCFKVELEVYIKDFT